MGDVADMMMDGILCIECGEYIGEDVGHPRKCFGCKPTKENSITCEICNKKLKPEGLFDHMKAKHADRV